MEIKLAKIGKNLIDIGDYDNHPLRFTAIEPNVKIGLKTNDNSPIFISLQYSTNGVNWTSWDGSDIILPAKGCKIEIKALNDNTTGTSYGTNSHYHIFTIKDGKAKCSGKLLYLLNKDANIKEVPRCGFYRLFDNCKNLVVAPNMYSDKLNYQSYYGLFYNCTGLTTPPKLKDKNLGEYCYQAMFYGCTQLEETPLLKYTNLANGCYYRMFAACYSLINPQELPAVEMKSACYSFMFQNCKNLKRIPKLNSTKLAYGCYDNMFIDCVNLDEPVELPSDTLVAQCYSNMFKNCSKINNITVGFKTWDVSKATENWLLGASTDTSISQRIFKCSQQLIDNTSSENRNESTVPESWNMIIKD